MSSHGNGKPPRLFSVSMSDAIKARLKRLHQNALEKGNGPLFLDAFRQIVDRLRHDPLSFGEPLYRLPALNLIVLQGVIAPLVVDFAVHEEKALVFINDFKVLS